MSPNTVSDEFPARIARIERAGYNLIAARYAEAAATRAELASALVGAAALRAGQKVLDIAAGPGTLTLAAAARVGSAGLAIASDLAEAALAECARLGAEAAAPAPACVAANAQRLPFRDGSFDRVLCGLGLMFFPRPEAALGEVRAVLRPGGALAVSVWGEAQEVPLVSCALECMRRVLPPPKLARPSVFRFGDPARLAALIEGAGFVEARVEHFALESTFPDPAAYWQSFLDLAGGAAWSLARLPADSRGRLADEVRVELSPWRQGSGYRMRSRVLIACARRPAPR
ncbi:MAG: hypothetical protein AUK49_03700 [Betaproteobacteria bacterium CG2_30_68_42]|nr:MAG: hypothetical protein AUK49_03700 [Betaproteobacteria bacterium CG2_30_68_42]